MSNSRTDLRTALGSLADLILPHLQGQAVAQANGMFELSFAKDSDFTVQGLARPLLPFQRAGVKYAVQARRSIIGDEMGLGKSVQFIATLLATDALPALVICPPSLTLNWKREFSQFAPQLKIVVISGQKVYALEAADVYVIGDSVIGHWADTLIEIGFKGFGIDESHRMKNYATKRTKAAKKISRKVAGDGVRVLLSGTPSKSTHLELLSQLDILGVVDSLFGSMNGFLDRFAPKADQYSREDANGEDLFQILRDRVMVRRLWDDVKYQLGVPADQTLRRLPSFVEMAGKAAADYKVAEGDLREYLKALKTEAEISRSMRAEKLVKLGALRQLVGKAKIPAVIAKVEELLEEDPSNQVIIFAWQREVVKAYAEYFGADTIMGGNSTEDVEAAKATFQAGNKRVIVLNHVSGGVGHTLTAANHVVFGEFEWTPGDMQQCEKRADRIGQTRIVTSHWCIAGNGAPTVDEKFVNIINAKGNVVGIVLDGKGSDLIDSESVTSALLASYEES